MATKMEKFTVMISEGKPSYICTVCGRRLSSKQRVLLHLHQIHKMSPLKKVRKLYLENENVPVPKRTERRWRQAISERAQHATANSVGNIGFPNFSPSERSSNEFECGNSDEASEKLVQGKIDDSSEDCVIVGDIQDGTLAPNASCEVNLDYASSNESVISDYKSENSEDLEEVDNSSYSSSNENPCSDMDDSVCSESDNETCISRSEECYSQFKNEHKALKILSCFQRNNLSGTACNDILKTFGSIFMDSKDILNYDYIQSFVGKHTLKEVCYCENCHCVFPNDPEVYSCATAGCQGLRYKGTLTQQQKQDRLPRKSFIIADIKSQLKDLLQTPGIKLEIDRCKADILNKETCDNLTDFTDGAGYRELLHSDNSVLKYPYSLTGILNTDGVNLYASSKVELWPVFLAVNELNPSLRFSRENMLLIAIWQGRGKPPFRQLFESLAEELNNLHTVGTEIEIDGALHLVTLSILCGVFDLPAKASILNMTYYNGKEACIKCKDPGIRVKQGKGTSHCYPYRNTELRFPSRQHETVMQDMILGTESKRVNGFKGVSGLTMIKCYNLVQGTVPDYMHCVLLGITNTLLGKWFSPSNSGHTFFIGKHIKKVSERLINIKPPRFIERLPRNLEKHFQHLKATELQAWLLYYSIPCLVNILPWVYLQHFAYLSEAVYILLGDSITPEQINRSETLLEKFYSKFEECYGSGSCGLNVHNACLHLIEYVKLWGPIWSWSCFPFEDANAMLLKSTHGTGNVMKQIMRYMETKSNLRRKGLETTRPNKTWKVTSKAKNADICGKLRLPSDEIKYDETVNHLRLNWQNIKQFDRINVNGKQFCSADYGRMEKRICYVVLFENDKVGNILSFLLDESTDTVFAVLQLYDTYVLSDINQLEAGKHVIPVRLTQQKEIVLVEQLLDTLMLIDIFGTENLPESYIILPPNKHGHAIFK